MAKETVFHFEHYPHYLGTLNNQNKVDIADIDALHDRYLEDQNGDELWEDATDLLNGYAQYDLLCNWPKIRKALETKGSFGDMWEEGSFGVSMQSMEDAKIEVGLIEAKIKMDEF